MKHIQIDERRSVLSVQNSAHASAFCCNHFLKIARDSISERPLTVALSGGNTPKGFYQTLTSSKEAQSLDWSQVLFFWSDERACPPEDKESNYRMCMEYFSKEPFCKAQFFRMPADAPDIQQAAATYERQIREHCFEQRFDIVYLGMGDDGHTASLFPMTKALHEKNRLVVANYIEAKKSWRMTLSFECINQARHIVVLVLGASKKNPLMEALLPQSTLPIWHVGTALSPAFFICDHEAYESPRH